jgi:hypothetical protein
MTDFTNGGFEDGLTGWSTAKYNAGDGWGIATTTGTTQSEGSNCCRLTLPTEPDKSIIIYQTLDLTNATGITFDYMTDGNWATGESNWLGAALQISNPEAPSGYDDVWDSHNVDTPETEFTATSADVTSYTGNCTVRVFCRWYTPV